MPLERNTALPHANAIKGRGAASWVPGRYEKRQVEGEDDGWGSLHAEDDFTPEPRPQTRVADFQKFLDATERPWTAPDFEQSPAHPVVNVTWDDASACPAGACLGCKTGWAPRQ